MSFILDEVMLLHRPEYGQKEITRSLLAPQQFFVDVAKTVTNEPVRQSWHGMHP